MIIKEHNKIAYERIKEGFKHSNKVATVCATGTGKSYQALHNMCWVFLTVSLH